MLVCLKVILSGAVSDELTEIQESNIMRPMMLQFRTLFSLLQTSLPSSLYMSMYHRQKKKELDRKTHRRTYGQMDRQTERQSLVNCNLGLKHTTFAIPKGKQRHNRSTKSSPGIRQRMRLLPTPPTIKCKY